MILQATKKYPNLIKYLISNLITFNLIEFEFILWNEFQAKLKYDSCLLWSGWMKEKSDLNKPLVFAFISFIINHMEENNRIFFILWIPLLYFLSTMNVWDKAYCGFVLIKFRGILMWQTWSENIFYIFLQILTLVFN